MVMSLLSVFILRVLRVRGPLTVSMSLPLSPSIFRGMIRSSLHFLLFLFTPCSHITHPPSLPHRVILPLFDSRTSALPFPPLSLHQHFGLYFFFPPAFPFPLPLAAAGASFRLRVVEEVEDEPEGLKKESRRFCCMAPRDA